MNFDIFHHCLWNINPLIRQRVKGYFCELDIPLFKWSVKWNHVLSPFNLAVLPVQLKIKYTIIKIWKYLIKLFDFYELKQKEWAEALKNLRNFLHRFRATWTNLFRGGGDWPKGQVWLPPPYIDCPNIFSFMGLNHEIIWSLQSWL